MKEDHEPGQCYACGLDKPVRWKNLYTIGSEGTNLCLECELIIVNMLRNMARDALRAKVKEIKERRATNVTFQGKGGRCYKEV